MTAARRPARTFDLRHPQLRPHAAVLARSADEWQVGFEPGRAVVVRGTGLGRVLPLLDGRHSMSALQAQARSVGVRDRQLRVTLAALLDAGLLTDGTDASAGVPGARIRLVGAGPLGAQLARLLAGDAVAALYVFDDEPPEPALYPSAGVLATRGQALCAALAGTPTTLTSVNHWSKPDAVEVDLTVVATEAPEVDRLVTDQLLRTDQPHLLVRSHRRGVCVGPLVVPGRTSCLRCADLARRDADPSWPTVLSQLVRLAQDPPAALAGWAAAVAAVQALAFLSGATPETWGSTLEIDGDDLAMRWRPWPVHAGCGCGWSVTTEWGA